MSRLLDFVRARPGSAAIVALAVAWGLTMHQMGWGQLANFAQVRALDRGQAQIDPWHWETKDKAYVDGHFYSVKAPGLPLATAPLYAALDRLGAQALATDAAAGARSAPFPKWTSRAQPPYRDHGYSESRAEAVGAQVESGTPIVWALTLFGAVLPAMALLFGVRRVADRMVPGFGAAAAITLGVATMVMTFAAEYFPHAAAAALGFLAFAVLMRERAGPPSLRAVGLAGLLAGLAVTFEFQLGLVGLILFAYALGRGPRLRRAGAYAAMGVIGALPVFVFNLWAFGSPLQFAYADAVALQGFTGHAVLGLNDDGFFGIEMPDSGAAFDLLFASRGLLTLTPVVAMGLIGAVLLRRDGHRAEANVIVAVTAAYFLYTSGYWLPFGGGTPGPRFLIPALPFLALGIAAAWRRLPALTLALAVPSALFMIAASITFPLIGENGTRVWAEQLDAGDLEHTLLTALGVGNPWLAIAPVLIAVIAAAILAARATPAPAIGDIRPALLAVGAWAVVSAVGPTLAGDPITPLGAGDGDAAMDLIGAGAAASAALLLALRWGGVADRRSGSGRAGQPGGRVTPLPP